MELTHLLFCKGCTQRLIVFMGIVQHSLAVLLVAEGGQFKHYKNGMSLKKFSLDFSFSLGDKLQIAL